MKLLKIFLYILCLGLILSGLKYLSYTRDFYWLFILNPSKYSMHYLTSLAILFVLPLFIFNKMKFIYFTVILSLCVFLNFLVLASSNIYIHNFIKLLRIDIIFYDKTLLKIFINMNIILIIIIFFLVQHLRSFTVKIEDVLYLLYLTGLFLYAVISYFWYFSVSFETKNLLSDLIYYSRIDFKYIVYNLFKQDFVFYMSIILLYFFWERYLFIDPEVDVNTQKRKKKTYIKLWMTVGLLGLDILYLKTKYKLINFHVITFVILVYFYYNYEQMMKYNILLYVVLIILLFVKIYYFVSSFRYSLKYEVSN